MQPVENPTVFLLLGVNGMGMAPLALYLLQQGKSVYGYDEAPRADIMAFLEKKGLKRLETVYLPQNTHTVVHTAAIAADDPFLEEVRRTGLPVLRRGDFLAQLSHHNKLIAIVGSHGKTTTTALAITLLQALELPWSFLLGGLFLSEKNDPARHDPSSPWLVAEIDESDGTIEGFSPEYTLILNYDWDHPTQYSTPEALQACLGRLMSRTHKGLLIAAQDPVLVQLASSHAGCPVRSVGLHHADYCYTPHANTPYEQTLTLQSPYWEPQSLALPMLGAFNAFNAAAATALITWACGHQKTLPAESFKKFPGLERRQQCLFESQTLSVYTDYAHHPTEIQALLHAITQTHPEKTLWVVFEPHRYTRTRTYLQNFVALFQNLPRLALLDVYASSEPYLPGGDTPALLQKLPHARYLANPQEALVYLQKIPKNPGSHLVFLIGAGRIDRIGLEFVKSFMPPAGRDASLHP